MSTRAHFAATIARALELSPSTESTFVDTKGKWFEEDVQALFEAGIVQGKGTDKFDPNAAITRQQAALMMMRVVNYLNIDTTKANASVTPFKDLNSVSPEAREAVETLQQLGIFTGKENGTFNPQDKLTCSQMTKIVYKLLEYGEFL